MNDNADEIVTSYKINNSKITTSRCFEYKAKIIGSTLANVNRLDTEVVVPLKYLCNFWRSLD